MAIYTEKRDILSPADFAPTVPEQTDRSVLGAAFRTENIVGASLRENRQGPTAFADDFSYKREFGIGPSDDYNAWSEITGTKYEEYWNIFAGSRSEVETQRLKMDIDGQLEDRQVLQAAGGAGVAAQMLAGTVDIPTLIPGGVAVRGARTGALISRNALNTARVATQEAVAVEFALQTLNSTRTAEESAAAIGGSIVLGGALGAAGAAMRRTPEGEAAFQRAVAQQNGRDGGLPDDLDPNLIGPRDLSAARAIRPELSDFNLPTKAAQAALDFTPRWVNFGTTFMRSASPKARSLGTELVDTPYSIQGVDRLDLQPAAEVAQAVVLDKARISIGRAFADGYGEYRRAQGVSRAASAINRVGDGNYTKQQFSQEVGKALRRGDAHENEFVQAAAIKMRSEVIDPLKDSAIKAGLLPEGVDVTTAASYFTRVWDPEKIVARADEFKARLTAHFDGIIRAMPDENLPDAEIEGYASEAAENVYRTLTNQGTFPDGLGLVPTKRGPLKERTLNVQDLDFEDFLNSDAEFVLNRYARVMTADIELTNRFGKADMEQQIDEINQEYNDLIEAAPKGKRNKLEAERQATVERLEAVRDLMRGTYKIGDRAGVPYRVIQSAMSYNFTRALGGLVMSALPDLYRATMTHGIRNTWDGAVRPLIANTKQYRLQAKQARELAGIAEVQLNNRMMAIADVTDPMGNHTPVEKAIQSMSSWASWGSGGNLWNDFMKGMATQVTTNRLRKLGASKADEVFRKRLKLNKRDAEAIKAEMKKHGTEEAGVFDPRTEYWNERTRDLYAQVMRADAETVVVTPGLADKLPAAEHHYWLKPMLQFKNFALAAHSRVMIAGLQEDQARFLTSAGAMAGMGMAVYWLKAVSSGREPSDNPGVWVAEGIDRSGVFPIVMELNNMLEGAGSPVGVYNILSMGEAEASRYAARSRSGKVFGPTAGLIDDMAVVVRMMLAQVDPSATEEQSKISDGDIGSARRLIPFGRHPGVKEFLDLWAVPTLKDMN